MDCVVDPFDQRYEAESGADKSTDPPEQNVVDPEAVIAGLEGGVFTVTITASEAILWQVPSLT